MSLKVEYQFYEKRKQWPWDRRSSLVLPLTWLLLQVFPESFLLSCLQCIVHVIVNILEKSHVCHMCLLHVEGFGREWRAVTVGSSFWDGWPGQGRESWSKRLGHFRSLLRSGYLGILFQTWTLFEVIFQLRFLFFWRPYLKWWHIASLQNSMGHYMTGRLAPKITTKLHITRRRAPSTTTKQRLSFRRLSSLAFFHTAGLTCSFFGGEPSRYP